MLSKGYISISKWNINSSSCYTPELTTIAINYPSGLEQQFNIYLTLALYVNNLSKFVESKTKSFFSLSSAIITF